jgi:RIO kinase 1
LPSARSSSFHPRFLDDTSDDDVDRYADYDQDFDDEPRRPRRRRPGTNAPNVVLEGRSGRREIDLDAEEFIDPEDVAANAARALLQGWHPEDGEDEAPFSSYDVATHGPEPVPDWLVTELSARDTRLGVLKTGKEADVSLLDRSLPAGPGCLLAVKTYRTSEHRMFHRDAGYQEGRRVRRSREGRAMAARSSFGRELLAGKWAAAEFAALCRLWATGARVPYPVQIIGSELIMQFIGTPDGVAAPRLAAHDADTAEFTELWHDLVGTLELLAEDGLTHGDLSPYNVLVDETGCVLIDLPQVVDLIANPQGRSYLDRDCLNIADFFSRRGVLGADGELLAERLHALAMPAGGTVGASRHDQPNSAHRQEEPRP